MNLSVSEDGIEVPTKYQTANKIVVRTPTATMNISSGFELMLQDGVFPLVKSNEFEEEQSEEIENPKLAPNKVSFKPHGEETEVFEVSVSE